MLFHAHVPPFSGGYVGVDVFFVVSGYLITAILLRGKDGKPLGLAEFYKGRIRRLIPALFAMLAACFAASWLFLFPDQFESFARSAVTAILFVSNFFFRAQADDYFSAPVALSPLLHTWSLAVEGQFYLVYPAFLLVARKLDRKRALILIGLATIVSFVLAQWAVHSHPKAAFYMAPTRGWEFLIGALIALDILPVIAARAGREITAALGVALILWPVFAFTPGTTFPGANALYPCLGTALVLYAGAAGPTLVGRLLETRLLTGIGLISYSLYLWHWPILVFCRQYFSTTDLDVVTALSALAASIGVAYLCWRLIEWPIHKGKLIRPRAIVPLASASAILGIAGSAVIIATAGFPARLPSDIATISAAANDRDARSERCLESDIGELGTRPDCRLGLPKPFTPSFTLWGDSHAGAVFPAIDQAATRRDLAGVFVGRPACPPLLDVTVTGGKGNQDCRAFNDTVMRFLRATPETGTVILMARWAIYAEGTRYGSEPGDEIVLSDDQTTTPGMAGNPVIFARALERTVTALQNAGKRVVLIGPVPEVGRDVPKSLARQALTGFGPRIAPTLDAFLARQKHVLEAIAGLGQGTSLTVIYPHETLCAGGTCRVTDGPIPLYFDDDHLSVHGARLISRVFDPVWRGNPAPRDKKPVSPNPLAAQPSGTVSKE